jgi:exopolysaccharide production protein ExoQ
MSVRILALLAAIFPLILMYGNRGMVPALGLLAIAGLWDLAVRRRWRWPLPKAATITGACFLIFAASSMLWEAWPGIVLPKLAAITGLTVGGILALGALSATPPAQTPNLRRFAAIGLWVAAIIAVVEANNHMALSVGLATLVDRPPPPGAIIATKFKAAAAVLCIWASLLVGFDLRDRRWGPAALSALAAGTLALVASSLAAILGLILAAVIWLGTRLAPTFTTRSIAGLSVLMLASPLLVSHLPSNLELAEDYAFLPNSAIHRVAIWQYGMEKSLDRPFLGWGLDSSRQMDSSAKVDFHDIHQGGLDPQLVSLMPLHPHNMGVQVWLELGGAGACLLATFLVVLVWSAARLPPATRAAVLAAFGAALIVASISFGAWQSWWIASLWLIAALTTVMLRPNSQRNEQIPTKA